MFSSLYLANKPLSITFPNKLNHSTAKCSKTCIIHCKKHDNEIKNVSKNITIVEKNLNHLLQKSKYCKPVPYERVKHGRIFSPACVIYWDEIDELSAKLYDLRKSLSKLEKEQFEDAVYLGFDDIESRFYDI
jgi:hypothetical protein